MPSRSRHVVAFALAALAAPIASPAQVVIGPVDGDIKVYPIPRCHNLPNGSFSSGFTNWTVTPTVSWYGDAYSGASCTIEDLTGFGGDSAAACLAVGAHAAFTCDYPSGSSAMAQVALSTTATVSGRYLRYTIAGGFEAIIFGKGRACYDAVVVVETADGRKVKCVTADNCFDMNLECDGGISILGGYPITSRCCDLAAGGIHNGDVVTITVIWSTAVTASRLCDQPDFGGTFCVDNFQFCTACPIIAEPNDPVIFDPVPEPARPQGTPEERVRQLLDESRQHLLNEMFDNPNLGDLNLDGRVDAADASRLQELLRAGTDSLPEGDMNRDGTLDARDLLEMLKRVK